MPGFDWDNTSMGQINTQISQSIHISCSIDISASFNSIQFTGHTPTQHPQKSHLLSAISIMIDRKCGEYYVIPKVIISS